MIDIDGDGSYLMTCYELATIAEYNIPVKVALLNNDFQGMIKQWQDLFYEKHSNSPMKNPNFAAMAEAFGVKGITCRDKKDVPKAVDEMLTHPGPVVVDFFVEPNEHVYPMVPRGQGAARDGAGIAGLSRRHKLTTATRPRRVAVLFGGRLACRSALDEVLFLHRDSNQPVLHAPRISGAARRARSRRAAPCRRRHRRRGRKRACASSSCGPGGRGSGT